MASGWNATSSTFTPPEWLDSGANAWQLTSATLVALQSIPGLLLLWGGIVPKKWALNSALMALYAFSSTLLSWLLFAFKSSFGVSILGGLWGHPGPSLRTSYLLSQATLPTPGLFLPFPTSTLIYFQFVFAALTTILISGSVLSRITFPAWALFVPLWLFLSYSVTAFSIWGGGWLAQLGVIDFAGGYVVHLAAGVAGGTLSFWVGPRRVAERREPSNMMFVLAGTGLLWTGWSGFNGGAPYYPSSSASLAVLNTQITTSVSMLSWMGCEWVWQGKVGVMAGVGGIVSGLVAITPCAGVIDGWAAIILGLLSGLLPFLSTLYIPRTRLFSRLDDPVSIFHTHAIPGLLGGVFAGIFATREGCAAFGLTVAGGAIEGNARQIGVQLAGAAFVVGWNVVVTSLICGVIRWGLRVPLRYEERVLMVGDEMIHGESAYHLLDDHQPNHHHSDDPEMIALRVSRGNSNGDGKGTSTPGSII